MNPETTLWLGVVLAAPLWLRVTRNLVIDALGYWRGKP